MVRAMVRAMARANPSQMTMTMFQKGHGATGGVTSPKAGTKKPPTKDSSLNVRINMDLRADVALELHAVIQGDVTIGLF